LVDQICGVILLLLVAVDAMVVRKGVSGVEDGHDDHISSSLQNFKTSPSHTESATADRKSTQDRERERLLPIDRRVARSQETMTEPLSRHPEQLVCRTHGTAGTSVEMPHVGSAASVAPGAVDVLDEAIKALGDQNAAISGSTTGLSSTGTQHTQAVLRAWVFFAALSLHGFFDGLSLGSESDVAGFTGVAIAVVSHKLFDGLALGCAIFPANLAVVQRWLLLIFCSATTPIGIVVGMVAESLVDSSHEQLVTGISLGLACGSFLFISLMELLPSSLRDGRWIKLKLLLTAGGFLVMASLAVVA
jgi:zinc transporter ZupT